MYVNGKAVTRADWVGYLITRLVIRSTVLTVGALVLVQLHGPLSHVALNVK